MLFVCRASKSESSSRSASKDAHSAIKSVGGDSTSDYFSFPEIYSSQDDCSEETKSRAKSGDVSTDSTCRSESNESSVRMSSDTADSRLKNHQQLQALLSEEREQAQQQEQQQSTAKPASAAAAPPLPAKKGFFGLFGKSRSTVVSTLSLSSFHKCSK